MTQDGTARLIKLSDSGHTVADPNEDVRGRKVRDRDGEDLGTVDDLLVDEREHKVRFLRVEHGGILGIGATPSFIPVDAVAKVTEDIVYVNESQHRVSGSPRYDPDVVDEPTFYNNLYDYYGYPPFWAPGYMYPGYPYAGSRVI